MVTPKSPNNHYNRTAKNADSPTRPSGWRHALRVATVLLPQVIACYSGDVTTQLQWRRRSDSEDNRGNYSSVRSRDKDRFVQTLHKLFEFRSSIVKLATKQTQQPKNRQQAWSSILVHRARKEIANIRNTVFNEYQTTPQKYSSLEIVIILYILLYRQNPCAISSFSG